MLLKGHNTTLQISTLQHSNKLLHKCNSFHTFAPTINKIYKRFNIIQVMYLSSEIKTEIFAKHGKGATDTGSAEGQVALFTYRIAHLTGHLKNNKKDFSTQLSLQKLVGKRRALLAYLYNKDIERYRAIIKALQLRDIIK